MGVGIRWIRLRMRRIEIEMRQISVGMWGMQRIRMGIWERMEIKRIRLEMRENWGKNKGVGIEMRHTNSGKGWKPQEMFLFTIKFYAIFFSWIK